jgi:hypothetical protein
MSWHTRVDPSVEVVQLQVPVEGTHCEPADGALQV